MIRAILGQQISVAAATTLAGRVAKRYGDPVGVNVPGLPKVTYRFVISASGKTDASTPEGPGNYHQPRGHDPSRRKAVVDGAISFDPAQDSDAFCKSLVALKGIGEWTAQYVAMRSLKDPDAFPHADLGLLRAFDTPDGDRMKPAELQSRAEGLASHGGRMPHFYYGVPVRTPEDERCTTVISIHPSVSCCLPVRKTH